MGVRAARSRLTGVPQHDTACRAATEQWPSNVRWTLVEDGEAGSRVRLCQFENTRASSGGKSRGVI